MPDVRLSAAPVVVNLPIASRVKLDAFLTPFCAGKDADLALACRQALNVRAVRLGRATDPEEIAFMPQEFDFLVAQIASTRDAMSELLGALQ
jgi:hypothetical protein